ncbi:ADP-ribosyltransferase domain-containing protein [Rhodopseudomonas palustris]|uniref:ADP-ribosyltransferase domain-containing protein n=1 Tax=Rhodopseudomonas palustris TaxID=1076 RepID=UPI002ACD7CA4|nr:ADP-ribosyltransferase domain-containing protein [Rhodopseudomonas palustris]WQH00672.1 ADP-ribosyltransferase domain-containing protein [Rhodopseudomonas palustris]
MRGARFFDVLTRLIGLDEASRCLRKICKIDQLDAQFHEQISNFEALAFYVYSTANGWHSYINRELWSGHPNPDVTAFAEVLNTALGKIAAITGKPSTVFRGYHSEDLSAFSASYAEGQIVRFPAFTSASFSETSAFGGNVLFIIRALSARAIWWLSPNFHEEEALLPTDCSFQVIDKELRSLSAEARLVIILQELTRRP